MRTNQAHFPNDARPALSLYASRHTACYTAKFLNYTDRRTNNLSADHLIFPLYYKLSKTL